MSPLNIFTTIVVLATYAGVAVGRVPGLRMNRATIALVGAAILVVIGAINEEQAYHALDMGTILLLAAMMVINANLRMAGFFNVVSSSVLRLAKSPRMLLGLVIVASGVLSAIFLNDPVCILFTPLVIDLCITLKRDPIPYLVGLGAAANVGSTATITGNPQNLIIGQASGIPFLTFLAHLGPVALIGLAICWVIIVVVYPSEFKKPFDTKSPTQVDEPLQTYPPLLNRTLIVVVGLMIAFLVGLPIVSSACIAAGLLLVSRIRPTKLLAIDWELLAFFAGLFIVTGAIEVTGLSKQLFEVVSPLIRGGVPALSLTTGALSNIVSNVPAVLLLRPEIGTLPNAQQAWLTLAMSSTLAGNLTLLGSAATLIVAEVAATRGVKLSFMAYLKAGVPITILTLIVGIVWLMVIGG
ncbi:MAG: anion transporter [Chloroflexi bacterium]|nr:anion transporter [Chloroflexota bacterium]MCC6895616.1 anion transporter [Anaerolineae bacterium]